MRQVLCFGGESRFSLRLGHGADNPQAIGSEAKAL